jgi:hypothetical protein
MTEIILILTVSIISIGGLIWAGVMGYKFFLYFQQIVEEVLLERKENE